MLPMLPPTTRRTIAPAGGPGYHRPRARGRFLSEGWPPRRPACRDDHLPPQSLAIERAGHAHTCRAHRGLDLARDDDDELRTDPAGVGVDPHGHRARCRHRSGLGDRGRVPARSGRGRESTRGRGAFVGDVVTYFDSAGTAQAYEAVVRDGAGAPTGWNMVEAWRWPGAARPQGRRSKSPSPGARVNQRNECSR